MASYTYDAYGITLTVPFRCPGLRCAQPGARADVTLREDAVPERLPYPVTEDVDWQADGQRMLLIGGPRQGRFLVQGGEVLLQRHPQATDEALSRRFTGGVLPALLTQRGMLVLHANAAATPDGAMVISGESGAGKSTTLAGLLEHGARMLSDDVTAIRLGAAGGPEVLPGEAKIHLTPAAGSALDDGDAAAGREPGPRGKYRMRPAGERMSSTAVPWRRLYELSTHAGEDVRQVTLTGIAKFAALQRCVYGPLLPKGHLTLFPAWRAIIDGVHVAQIVRPREGWTVPEVCEALLAPLAAP